MWGYLNFHRPFSFDIYAFEPILIFKVLNLVRGIWDIFTLKILTPFQTIPKSIPIFVWSERY